MTARFATPLGTAVATFDNQGSLAALSIDPLTEPDPVPAHGPAKGVADELDAYFAGTLRAFTLPLAPAGTPFQREVWAALLRIPYGETRTYADLAREIGRPAAVRAVGAANGANPIWLVVPCHRVVGSGGALTGYAGGLPLKRWLLQHEGALPGTLGL